MAIAPTNSGIPALPAHSGPLTALQLVDRILAKAGPGSPSSTDRIVAGDPLTPVTGIATTAIATMDTLAAAAKQRCNLVVSYDPTFWATGDQLDRLEGDPLFLRKRDFIREHGLVVLNLHDRWSGGIADGMARQLGWEGYRDGPAGTRFTLPPTTLLALARQLRATLDDRTLRVVGDPALPVTRVAASWGNTTQLSGIALLNSPADVVVCGYAHEWETVEYAQDMVATGAKKGLILLGEIKSVEGGMRHCADWLRSVVTEVPVTFIAVAEPYWNPAQRA
ncbi:Nif3-like dinuclear metal center hexameric protein [Glacieibacterium sp.]|uniref:Nif3-like dinuclear metal center hexameric protein n=1 Tax=Glacieibacterium sp. TaxID=2860237 RepID=UPI003B005A6A